MTTQDKFNYTLNHLKEQFGGRLEIDTKDVAKALDVNESTIWRRLKYGETHLLPNHRPSGSGKGQKSCGRYKWPIYDLAVFLTQDQSVSA